MRQALSTLLVSIVAVGCGSTVGGSPVAVSEPPPPSAAPTAAPSTEATPAPSPRPDVASIPGFEEWAMVNGYAADVAVDEGTLAMTLLTRKLWFRDEQGVLLWTPVTGDFSLTGTVRTSRATDPARPLEQNGTVQLGGLMARDPSLPSENYVFIVAGNDADGPAVETKTTRVSQSTWDGPDWPAPDADLRLCRIGDTFRLLKRPADADEAWELALEVDRPEMEAELQVGPNIYSDGPPDLAVRYEDLTLETGTPADSCEAG